MSLKQVGAEALQPVGQGWQDSKAVRQYGDAAAHCISELTATQLLPLEAQEGQVSRASQRQVSAVLLDGLNKLSNALKGKAHEQIHTFIPQTGAAPFSRQQVTLLQPSVLQRTLLTCRDAQSRTTAVTQLPGHWETSTTLQPAGSSPVLFVQLSPWLQSPGSKKCSLVRTMSEFPAALRQTRASYWLIGSTFREGIPSAGDITTCKAEGKFTFQFPSWRWCCSSEQDKDLPTAARAGRQQRTHITLPDSELRVNPISFKQAQTTLTQMQPLVHLSHSGLVSHGDEASPPVPGQLEKPLPISGRGNTCQFPTRTHLLSVAQLY